jgi:hypothetical protein
VNGRCGLTGNSFKVVELSLLMLGELIEEFATRRVADSINALIDVGYQALTFLTMVLANSCGAEGIVVIKLMTRVVGVRLESS